MASKQADNYLFSTNKSMCGKIVEADQGAGARPNFLTGSFVGILKQKLRNISNVKQLQALLGHDLICF